MGLTDRVNKAENQIARKAGMKARFRKLLAAALMGGAVLVAGEIINPAEAHACANFYNPDNSFYNRHIKPIANNPEILQNEGDKAYAILWFPSHKDNLVDILNYPESTQFGTEQYFPEFVPKFIYTDKEKIQQKPAKITLYPDLNSALNKLRSMRDYSGRPDVYILGLEVVRYSETTPITSRIIVHPKEEVIASSLHNSKGSSLKLRYTKPTLIKLPQNPSRECRTMYRLPK